MFAVPSSPSLLAKESQKEERAHSTAPHTPRSTTPRKSQFIRLTQHSPTPALRPLQELKKLHSQNLQPSRILPLEDIVSKSKPRRKQNGLRQRLKGVINMEGVVLEVPQRGGEKVGRMWESVPLSWVGSKENQEDCPESPIHRLLDGSMARHAHNHH